MMPAHDDMPVYRLATPPEALPAVRCRDLAAAWEAAREAARAQDWGEAARFRFERGDGTAIELAFADQEARCWATAVDRVAALRTAYGASLCLRLLALVALLANAPWAAGLVSFEAGLVKLHPALLRLAAAAPLSPEGVFDEHGFRAALVNLPVPSLSGAAA